MSNSAIQLSVPSKPAISKNISAEASDSTAPSVIGTRTWAFAKYTRHNNSSNASANRRAFICETCMLVVAHRAALIRALGCRDIESKVKDYIKDYINERKY